MLTEVGTTVKVSGNENSVRSRSGARRTHTHRRVLGGSSGRCWAQAAAEPSIQVSSSQKRRKRGVKLLIIEGN